MGSEEFDLAPGRSEGLGVRGSVRGGEMGSGGLGLGKLIGVGESWGWNQGGWRGLGWVGGGGEVGGDGVGFQGVQVTGLGSKRSEEFGGWSRWGCSWGRRSLGQGVGLGSEGLRVRG